MIERGAISEVVWRPSDDSCPEEWKPALSSVLRKSGGMARFAAADPAPSAELARHCDRFPTLPEPDVPGYSVPVREEASCQCVPRP